MTGARLVHIMTWPHRAPLVHEADPARAALHPLMRRPVAAILAEAAETAVSEPVIERIPAAQPVAAEVSAHAHPIPAATPSRTEAGRARQGDGAHHPCPGGAMFVLCVSVLIIVAYARPGPTARSRRCRRPSGGSGGAGTHDPHLWTDGTAPPACLTWTAT